MWFVLASPMTVSSCRVCRRTKRARKKNDNLFIYIVRYHCHTVAMWTLNVIAYIAWAIFVVCVFVYVSLELHFVCVGINEMPLREMREINKKHLIIYSLFFPSSSSFSFVDSMRAIALRALDTYSIFVDTEVSCLFPHQIEVREKEKLFSTMDVRVSFVCFLDLSHFYCQRMCETSILSIIMYDRLHSNQQTISLRI